LWRYEIDLHSKKAAALRKSLSEFVAGARHVKNTSPFAEPTPPPAGQEVYTGEAGGGLSV